MYDVTNKRGREEDRYPIAFCSWYLNQCNKVIKAISETYNLQRKQKL